MSHPNTRDRCNEPMVSATNHVHRCVVSAGEKHPQGSGPADDFITDIHECACKYTWVVN